MDDDSFVCFSSNLAKQLGNLSISCFTDVMCCCAAPNDNDGAFFFLLKNRPLQIYALNFRLAGMCGRSFVMWFVRHLYPLPPPSPPPIHKNMITEMNDTLLNGYGGKEAKL